MILETVTAPSTDPLKITTTMCRKKNAALYDNYISNSKYLCNIVQTKLWRSKLKMCNINDDYVLPLTLYYDDFEVGNPLGNRAGMQKLGGGGVFTLQSQ